MLEYAINNETMRGANLPPFLTDNLIYWRYDAMAKTNIAKSSSKSQSKRQWIGEQFGRLTVIGEVERYAPPCGKTFRRFECQCSCGNKTIVVASSLSRGATRSCGCLHDEINLERSTKHGKRYHPIYDLWRHIKGRCYNENNTDYKNYGDRGITVCDEWLDDFMTFFMWAKANGWEKGLRIDRENNDGNYDPENCRFVDAGLSARNKRLLDSTNRTGFRGPKTERNGRWQSKIVCDGKAYCLGTFDTLEDAAMAYDKKAIELDAGHPLNFGMEEAR